MALRWHTPGLWLGACSIAESIGDSMGRTLVAIVAVDVVGAGAGLVGVLNSAGMLAFLLLGVPLGVWVDRVGRPAAFMRAGTLVRAVVVLAALVTWWAGALHGVPGIVLLLGVALVIGIADVVFTTGQGVLVPSLVPADGVRRLYGLVQTWTRTGSVVGTLLLPLILVVVAPPAVWAVVGAAYLVSVLMQRGISTPHGTTEPRPAGPRASPWHQVRRGTSHLLREPTLLRITAANMLVNAAVMCANTLLPVIALTILGLPPSTYAFVGIAGSLAGIAGAVSSHRLGKWLGLRGARLLSTVAMAVGAGLVMCSGVVVDWLPGTAAIWLMINSALAGFFTSLAIVLGSDLVPALTAPEELGVVLGAQRTLVMGSMPVAALVTGVVAGAVGPAEASWLWLALLAASALPVLRLRDIWSRVLTDLANTTDRRGKPHMDASTQEKMLRRAIQVSEDARQHGNHPFGAVLVAPDGSIVLEAENTVNTDHDVTGHAETNLVREASGSIPRAELAHHTLVTSCEPCAMCSGAIYWSGISTVVYGLSETGLKERTGDHPDNPTLTHPCRSVFADGTRSITVVGPLLEAEAALAHERFWGSST